MTEAEASMSSQGEKSEPSRDSGGADIGTPCGDNDSVVESSRSPLPTWSSQLIPGTCSPSQGGYFSDLDDSKLSCVLTQTVETP